MSLATEKDEVLIRLRSEKLELNLAHYDFLIGDQKAFGELFYTYKDELVLKGFIRCISDNGDFPIDSLSVRIRSEGLVFLSNGGYTLIEQKEQKEERRKDLEWRWRRGFESSTLIVSIFALILSVVTFCSTPRENQIEKLNQRIDSLSHQVDGINRSKVNPQNIVEGKSEVKIAPRASPINAQ